LEAQSALASLQAINASVSKDQSSADGIASTLLDLTNEIDARIAGDTRLLATSLSLDLRPQRVLELLKSVAANHQSIAKEPAPQAYIVNFAPGAVSLQLQAWTDRYEDWVQVRSDLSLAVDQALTRENITIA
jgi:small-conductance mechanosensitive channel